MMDESLFKKYMLEIGDTHEQKSILNRIDFRIRSLMGKTKKTKSVRGYASHMEVLRRQRNPNNHENHCRICGKEFTEGVARYNDYLVIRASDCPSATCLFCSKNLPDEYHKSFKRAMRKVMND